MTDKGYYDPARANGHDVHESGAANGHSSSTAPAMVLERAVWHTDEIVMEDEADSECATEPPALHDNETVPNGDVPSQEPDAIGDINAEPDDASADTAEDSPSIVDEENAPQADDLDADDEADANEAAAPVFTDEDRFRHLRMGEALLFASAEPLSTQQIADRLPDGADVERVLADLAGHYEGRGVSLMRVAGGWAFRTATDLSFLMERERVEQRKLSRAALETLAIIAYHQPVTRAEIEDVRGVSVSKGTLDVLMEVGWVRVRGRRRTPGRPVTYGTSDAFLEHFGLDRVSDLPGLDELKAAGLLDTQIPTNISIPKPSDDDESAEDEDEEQNESAFGADEEDAAEAGMTDAGEELAGDLFDEGPDDAPETDAALPEGDENRDTETLSAEDNAEDMEDEAAAGRDGAKTAGDHEEQNGPAADAGEDGPAPAGDEIEERGAADANTDIGGRPDVNSGSGADWSPADRERPEPGDPAEPRGLRA